MSQLLSRPRTPYQLLLLLLWPLVLLGPCLFGERVFLPYHLAQFPPASTLLAPSELEELRAGNNFDVTETPVWFVPELTLARQALLIEHALPEWNPNARTGTALLAHGHDGILHPPVWLALLCSDPAAGLSWVALLQFTLAAWLMFGFLRSQNLSAAASTLGALGFAASSTMAGNAHNYPRMGALIWLPGMLWGLRAAADGKGRARWAPLCGFAACFALTWLAGFPPYALPGSLLALAYGAVLLVQAARSDGRAAALRLGGAGAVALLLAVLLCSHYLLPAFAFFGESARSLTPDLARISHSAFEHYGLLGWLAPDLFGRPDLAAALPYDKSALPLLLGNRCQYGGNPMPPNFNSMEYAVFAGAFVLWLAVVGLADRSARHRWFPLLAMAVLVACATFTPPFHWLFALPGVAVVPPMRCIGPCCLLLAWLAAHGLDAVRAATTTAWPLRLCGTLAVATALLGWLFAARLDEPDVFEQWQLPQRAAARFAHLGHDADWVRNQYLRSPDGKVDYLEPARLRAAAACRHEAPFHLAVGIALWLCALAPHRRRTLLAAVALLSTGYELWFAAQTFDQGVPAGHSSWTPVHDFLVQQRREHAGSGGFMVARAAPPAKAAEVPAVLPPGTLQPYGIRDLQVYTFYDKRSIAPLAAVFGSGGTDKGYVTQFLPDDERLEHPLLDFLGIRYLLAAEPLTHAGARVAPATIDPRATGIGERSFVYERSTALPRAFVVPELRTLADDAAVLAAMASPSFRPREIAYTTVADVPAPAVDPAAAARSVRFVTDQQNQIELELGPGPAGWLVLADTFLPGWTATMGELPVPLLCVNHAFRGVAVPAGACRVRFDYRTPGLRTGLWLSTFAAVALLLLALRSWRSSATQMQVDTTT